MSEYRTPQELAREAIELRESIRRATAGGEPLGVKLRRTIPQQEMPTQAPGVRIKNMEEVALGYTEDQAIVEASRCLGCAKAPCVSGCPVAIDIPSFLADVAAGRFDDASATIRQSSMLPAICGRVCPQEKQCMAACTVGKAMKDPEKAVAIGRIERFLADRDRESAIEAGERGSHSANADSHPIAPGAVAEAGRVSSTAPGRATPAASRLRKTGKRVAVVGSGPSGLTCAADLAKLGHEVTIFEAFHKAGGVTVYGIPEFRLPKAIVEDEVRNLEALGVRIVTDFLVGRTRTVRQFLEEDGFDAVYIANGAGLPKFMSIPGEDLVGVFSANEFLTRSNLMKAYDREHAETPLYHAARVAVFGGGNVAMDAARTALRTGSGEVRVIYRRTKAEMPARVEEVHHAEEEGVIFDFLTNPIRILGDEKGRVVGVECLRYVLGEPDASGRASPVPVQGSEFRIDVDACIVSLGNASNPLVTATTPGLELTKRGNIIVDPSGETSIPGVFAGGDIVQGAATVILAMGDGRRAAAGIDRYLTGPS